MSAVPTITSTSLPSASDDWPLGLRPLAPLFDHITSGQDHDSSQSIRSLSSAWLPESGLSYLYYQDPHEGSEGEVVYAHISHFVVQSLMSIVGAHYDRSSLDQSALDTRAQLRIVLDASTGPTELESDPRKTSINRLSAVGRTEAAEKLTELMFLIDEDPDEPDLDADSLIYFADFLIDEPNFETPVIGIDPEGRVQAEWPVLSQGLLVLNFRQDGLVRFVALSEPARPGRERMRVSGTLRKRDALRAVEPFRK